MIFEGIMTRRTYLSRNPSASISYHALAIQEPGKPLHGEVCITGKMDNARRFEQLLIPFVIEDGKVIYDILNAYEPQKKVMVALRCKQKGEDLSGARKLLLEAILGQITPDIVTIESHAKPVQRELIDGNYVVQNFGQNKYSPSLYEELSRPEVTGLRLKCKRITITPEMVGKPKAYSIAERHLHIIYTPMGAGMR